MVRYALVIGISQYDCFNNLSKPAADAEAVAQILERYGNFEEVKRLPAQWNPHQSCYEIADASLHGRDLGIALQEFLTRKAARGEALIYFSGHGFILADNLGKSEGYLAPSDCVVEFEGSQIVGQRHGISLDSLNRVIGESDLSSLVMVLDCCNSGYFLERGAIERTLTAFNPQRDYYLVAACRSFEQAWEGKDYSVFTEALLEGLSAKNAGSQGRISGDRLFDYISNALRNSGQEPIRMGWGRSILLVTHPLPPPVTIQESYGDRLPGEQLAAGKGALQPSTTPFNPENPYIGLHAFESKQARYFYGREQPIRALLDFIKQGRFLAVVGASGCGKSSLVKAGLMPELERDRLPDSSGWKILSFTPGKHPVTALLAVLNQHAQSDMPLLLFVDQFEEVFTLCEDDTERENFMRLMAGEATNPERCTRVIVAIRGDFLDRCAPYPEVAGLINRTQPTTYIVPALTVIELEDVIKEPAQRHGVTFEDGLVSQIITDVIDRPGALPLLQYALMELWRVCINKDAASQPQLTRSGYNQIGGVKGALNQRADLLYHSFSPADQEFVRCLFLELVQIGDGQEVTRRRVRRQRLEAIADSPHQFERIVHLLAGQQQRLIVMGEQTVEVAHEALLTEWSRLKDWIEADQEHIRLGRLLETNWREWQDRFHKSDDALLAGARLAVIEEWVNQSQPKLPQAEQEYLQRSIACRDRQLHAEAERERQQKRLYRRVAVWSSASLACITILMLVAGVQWRNADKGQIQALVASSDAKFNLNVDTFDGLMEGLSAGRRLQQSIWFKDNAKLRAEVMQVLGQAMYWVKERNRLLGHQDIVQSVSFSPDGQAIATSSYDGTIKLWNLHGGTIRTLEGHGDAVMGVCFIPHNTRLVSGSLDGTVKIWQRDGTVIQSQTVGSPVWSISCSPDGSKIAIADKSYNVQLWDINQNQFRLLGRHDDAVYHVSFSPDGRKVASTSKDMTAKLWDLNGAPPVDLTGYSKAVVSVSFSPKNNRIATASSDKSIRLWEQNGKPLEPIPLDVEAVSVRFSPDGDTLAVADVEGAIQLFTMPDGQPITTLTGHQDEVNSISFSPDGTMLASASNDQTTKLWMPQPDAWLRTLTDHHSDVSDVKFSPDGQTIATASYDNTVMLWDVAGHLLHRLNQHQVDVATVGFSPDSRLLASGDRDGVVHIWNREGDWQFALPKQNGQINKVIFSPPHSPNPVIVTAISGGMIKFWDLKGKPVGELPKQDVHVWSVSISPDGKTIATGSENGTVKLWDWNGQVENELNGHQTVVWDVSFSPNGEMIATASQDNTVKLWNRNGELLHELGGHTAAVSQVSFSQDSSIVATASNDSTIKLWSTQDGKLTTTLAMHADSVNSVSFNPQKTGNFASASADNTIILWNLEDLMLKSLMERGCSWLRDYLRANPNNSTGLNFTHYPSPLTYDRIPPGICNLGVD
jgi:WD40 repeat protein/energy-coupling factor transporter ATP-binding protein EcfA2